MEYFDSEKAKRVWQRVQGTATDLHTDSSLPELLAGALEDSAVYLGLSRRFRGHSKLILQKLHKEKQEQAAVLRGRMLYVDRRDLKLPKGHYLVQDLIGLTIVDADDGSVVYGTLTDVSQTGANAVYHMMTDKGEVLIPAIPDVIIEINLKKDILRLRPMKGLLDDDEI